MITAIHLHLLRNGEYLQFFKDILSLVDKTGPALALGVQAQYDDLVQNSGKLEALFANERGSPITPQIIALDKQRDQAMIGITGVVKSYTRHFDAAMVSHAKNLLQQIKLYGKNIIAQNYQGQTPIIKSMLHDFKTMPPLAQAINALHINDWCQQLEAINIAFGDAYLQRAREKGNKDKTNMVAQRKQANAAYNKLRDFINSQYIIHNGADPYGKLTNVINALIEQYNDLMSGR